MLSGAVAGVGRHGGVAAWHCEQCLPITQLHQWLQLGCNTELNLCCAVNVGNVTGATDDDGS
ncbi:hypothetical protein HaLaN_05570 [Haematococcus lacustris]|uniref:Uncharacterized protein n=1 Tax=Haematococcus lacustris TaxID=44745 RepID=A0A699YTJ1_HAELA|nr:hypothetical protein HaLaN_05570 [Haematococcus lacustris]